MIQDDRDEPTDGADEGADAAPAADPTRVVELTDRILSGLGLDLKAKIQDTGSAFLLDLKGEDGDFLLSHKGEALSALQYLLNRIVYRGRRGKKIQVDCGGFRKMREDEVVEIALRTAEKAKAKGEECLLSPLNPYERRLVHLALAEVEGVETHSIGDGFLKRIAIVPLSRRVSPAGPDER